MRSIFIVESTICNLDRSTFMPTYEYRCRKCGKLFERNEHISEHGSKRAHCPKCKSTQVSQVPGAFFAKTSKKS